MKRESATILVRISIAAGPKSKLGRKEFIWFTLPQCCSLLKQGGQKAGADAVVMEGSSLLAASPGLLGLLSYRAQDYQPRDGTTHNGLGPPHLITNWENALQLDFMEAFSLGRLFLNDNSSLCQVDTHRNQPVQLTPCHLGTQTHHY